MSFDSMMTYALLVGVAMETEDLAFPLMRRINVCSDAREAISDASAVIFLEDDDSPEPDESRDEFLRITAGRYQEYSRIIDDVAMDNAKASALTMKLHSQDAATLPRRR